MFLLYGMNGVVMPPRAVQYARRFDQLIAVVAPCRVVWRADV